MDNYPIGWARVIAAAWLDDDIKARLKTEPENVFKEFGLTYDGRPVPHSVLARPEGINTYNREESSGNFISKPNSCTCSMRINTTKEVTTVMFINDKMKPAEKGPLHNVPMKIGEYVIKDIQVEVSNGQGGYDNAIKIEAYK